VKSRIVSQSTFELIVLMDMVDAKEKCIERNKMKINFQDTNVKFDNYKDKLHNYCISKYEDTIYNLDDVTLRKIIEKDVNASFNDNWKFVY